MICCDTVIGQGSPNKAGTHDVHGSALGAAEAATGPVTIQYIETTEAGPQVIAETSAILR